MYPFLVKKGKKFPVILIVDGHATHLTLKLSLLCDKLKIILIALHPNASRILQFADVSCFRPIKNAWHQGTLTYYRENPGSHINRETFAPVL